MNVLFEDIAQLKKIADNVGFYFDDSQTNFVVRFSLDTSYLEKFTASKWGVKHTKPIIVQLKLDSDYTASANLPGILVFQSEDPHLNNPTLAEYETEFGIVQWFLETR